MLAVYVQHVGETPLGGPAVEQSALVGATVANGCLVTPWTPRALALYLQAMNARQGVARSHHQGCGHLLGPA